MNTADVSHHDKNVIFIAAQSGYDHRADRMLSSIESQTRQSLENIINAIKTIGLNREHIAICRIYFVDENDINVIQTIYSEFFDGVRVPPHTMIGVAFLPRVHDTRAFISIEAVAIQN